MTGGTLLGFPPGRHFVVVPARPTAAARAGLVLYDAVSRRQLAALAAARALLRVGWTGPLRLRHPPPLPDADWWGGWLAAVARPHVGDVAATAYRLLGGAETEPDRFTSVLLDGGGRALAFAKVWQRAGDPEAAATTTVLERLAGRPGAEFAVPGLVDAGVYGDRHYVVQQPMPERHRPVPPDPGRLRRVVGEVQERLGTGGGPPGQVPVHGSFTPMNLRTTRDGRLWLLDWDKAGWGPPGYDELRYWIAALARRGWGPPERRATRIVAASGLDRHATAAALAWRMQVRPREVLPAEQAIRDALERELA